MKKYIIKFNNWLDGDNNPRVIEFTNNGQFTKNSLTSNIIPQNEEMFEDSMRAYLNNEECERIYE